MEEKENKTLGDQFEEWLEISLVNAIAKGLSIAATILFGCLCIIMGIVALFSGPSWPWYTLLFVISGLLTGVSGGFSYYLLEEF